MTNSRSTKSALFTSVVAILLCCTMLLGTTFAWFTDTAQSSGNKIQAGNLDIELLMHNGEKYDYITNESAPIFGPGSIAQNNSAETLWEPGKTQVVYLAIENKGNLDAKYIVELDVRNPKDAEGNDISKNLYKAMQYAIVPDAAPGSVTAWNVADVKNITSATKCLATNTDVFIGAESTHYFALAVHMKEEAGNEFQGGAVEFDIVVQATQAESENDSFGNDYDATAGYNNTPKANVELLPVDELNIGTVDVSVIENGDLLLFQYEKEVVLDCGYNFEATENEEDVLESPYKNWKADFVVSVDKDIDEGTLVGLAGNYGTWGWLAFETDDGLEAGKQIRLLKDLTGDNISINYTELCTDVKVFKCGAFAPKEDATGESVLKGTTLTVELRLYETKDPSETDSNTSNEETGKSILIGTYNYTFGESAGNTTVRPSI